MARTTPRVESSTLIGSEGAAAITVGTPAWYTWLEGATAFAFVSAQGTFTARKERGGRTGWYWKAYRKQVGKVRSAYLGRSADLTFDRLIAAAAALAQASEPADQGPAVPRSPPIEEPEERTLAKRPTKPTIAPIDRKPKPTSSTPALDGSLANRAAPASTVTLPTGTITFLFTDIEGSTHLWEQHPEAMRLAIARHNSILRDAIEGHSGVIFKTVGDEVCAAFARAPDALAAAHAAQCAILAEPWSAIGPLRVRMAGHTGTAELRDGDYFGLSLSRIARLVAAGHGGQILLSRATQELVRDHLPPLVELRDLGEHRLRDLTRPEQIFQLVAHDLPTDFPPLKTLELHRTNLPAQVTTLTGREQEVVTVCALLRRADVRLLTLTGPGGVGKTRLGLQIAAELLDDFRDGVYFVTLAPINEATLVISSIAQVLGVKEAGGQMLRETLQTYLRDKQLLLLLDNFEQVLDAAPLLASLLTAAPYLNLLVTSRAALHLSGEHEFAVPPLALPEPRYLPPAEMLSQYAAVALFIERAQAVKPDFVITNDNAPAVAEICSRLDGLPLAIELAAARSKLLSPPALLARLTSRLQMLTGGPRDLPARQQTLRSTIEWSYNLLATDEQALFRRLAVFVGGCTLDAVEAVYHVDAWRLEIGDVPPAATFQSPFALLDGLAALVDQSLVHQGEQADGEPRFVMLETIREYALERLVASGEAAITRQLHAHFFLGLAQAAEPQLTTGKQRLWLERLEQEHDNLRAALAWSQSTPGGAELGLWLAAALWWFWWVRGYVSEGRAWLEGMLAQTQAELPAGSDTYTRATALYRAGYLAWAQDNYPRATALCEESLALFKRLGNRCGIGWAHYTLGLVALMEGDYARAAAHYEESLALFREVDDRRGIAWTLNNLGVVSQQGQGDYAPAKARFEESLALWRAMGNTRDIANCLNNLGEIARCQGDYAWAAARYEESLGLFQEVGDTPGAAICLLNLGFVALAQDDYGRAKALLVESSHHWQKIAGTFGIALCLTGLAAVAAAEGQLKCTTRLLGAAEAQHANIYAVLDPSDRAAYDRNVTTVRAQLGEAAFAAAWAEGRALTLDQALALIEEDERLDSLAPQLAPSARSQPPAPRASFPAGLTEREVEVLRLLAQGLSYAQIAETLVISPRTVNRHLTSIYSKLDVTSRHAAARFAIDHHLV
jgi:predicted ATPase/class 3 adenylate cyclase/DNA-binding CsgD family transcriptional regulator